MKTEIKQILKMKKQFAKATKNIPDKILFGKIINKNKKP